MHIGFIGLGHMGSAIAANLIKAGHQLTVYNRTRSRAETVGKLGARVAATPGQAAADAQLVISMLADDHALEEVAFAPEGLVDALAPGAVHVCMSTISVQLSRRLKLAHNEKGQSYVAAPVFGRPDAAAAAKLFIVAAGPAGAIERCRPVFDAMGQRTFEIGQEAPEANVVKLAGNFMITSVIESLAEATSLVRKHGVDPEAFLDILTGSLFTAPVYQTYGRMVATENFEPVGFKMQMGLKDNHLLLAAAEQASVPMPLASLVHDRFLTALAQGMNDVDWAAIARISFQDAGL